MLRLQCLVRLEHPNAQHAIFFFLVLFGSLRGQEQDAGGLAAGQFREQVDGGLVAGQF